MRVFSLLITVSHTGIVRKVLVNSLSTLKIREGMKLLDIFNHDNLDKAQRFFLSIVSDEVVPETELIVDCISGEPMVLNFRGIKSDDECLILADASIEEILEMYHMEMRINNQLVNAIRNISKENTTGNDTDGSINYLEELSKVNNDLISLQRELSKKNVELAKLNELKNRFVGIAAHDLRNPLSAISSFSNFLMDETQTNSPHYEFIKIIKETSTFMLKMVENLLDLTLIESGKVQLELSKTDFEAIYKDSIHLHQNLAGKKGIKIIAQGCPSPCVIEIDQVKIKQVMSNLIGNAIKYSPPDTEINIKAIIEDNFLKVCIKDQGYGIKDDEQSYIFEPFKCASSSTKTNEQSAGLGLSITKNIVEAHKGNITVESKPGYGSTFCFNLPISQSSK